MWGGVCSETHCAELKQRRTLKAHSNQAKSNASVEKQNTHDKTANHTVKKKRTHGWVDEQNVGTTQQPKH